MSWAKSSLPPLHPFLHPKLVKSKPLRLLRQPQPYDTWPAPISGFFNQSQAPWLSELQQISRKRWSANFAICWNKKVTSEEQVFTDETIFLRQSLFMDCFLFSSISFQERREIHINYYYEICDFYCGKMFPRRGWAMEMIARVSAFRRQWDQRLSLSREVAIVNKQSEKALSQIYRFSREIKILLGL